MGTITYKPPDNPSTPAAALAMLTADPHPQIRRDAARNRRCSPGLLARLVADTAAGPAPADMRIVVAGNPNCDSGLLEQLAGHVSPWVRGQVCEHPACPAQVLRRLSVDNHPDVRDASCAALSRR